MANPMEPQRRWWQFSLRELILFIAVLALVLSHARILWTRSQGPSPFFEQIDVLGMCELAGKRQDTRLGSGSGGRLRDDTYCVQSYFCRHVGHARRERVVAELRKLIVNRLMEFHCVVTDSVPQGDSHALADFYIEYSWRDRRGSIDVASVSEPEDMFRLIVTWHEARVGR